MGNLNKKAKAALIATSLIGGYYITKSYIDQQISPVISANANIQTANQKFHQEILELHQSAFSFKYKNKNYQFNGKYQLIDDPLFNTKGELIMKLFFDKDTPILVKCQSNQGQVNVKTYLYSSVYKREFQSQKLDTVCLSIYNKIYGTNFLK